MFRQLVRNHFVVLAIAGLFVAAACTPTAPAPAEPPPPAPADPAPPKPAEAEPAPPPAPAEPAAEPAEEPAPDDAALAEFYAGETMRLIISSPPGGGFDTYGRVIAHHIGRQLPGNPSVIVENMPGAGSMIATNHLYNVAPKDGMVIGHINGGVVLQQLFDAPEVEFDVTNFGFLGLPVMNNMTCIAHSRTGITSLEQTLGPDAETLIYGTSGVGNLNHVSPAVFIEAVDASIELVVGYPGVGPMFTAMERGEIDGYCLGWESLKTGPVLEAVESGDVNIVAEFSHRRPADLPDTVPAAIDMAETDEARQLIRVGSILPNIYLRLFVTPPDLPPDRLAALQSAFMATLSDPEFLNDAQRAQTDIDAVEGDEARQLVLDQLDIPEDLKDQLRPMIVQ